MSRLIKRPIFTEKTIFLLETNNQYVFDTEYKLTKPQIRLIVEKLFSVRVKKLNTHNQLSKKRLKTGGFRINLTKRVVVKLYDQDKLIFF